MSVSGLERYSKALKGRRKGVVSSADGSTPFPEAKPEFYADAKILIGEVQKTYSGYREQYPPYGLMTSQKEPIQHFAGPKGRRWTLLELALSNTARAAFNETVPSIRSCPYEEALHNLGSTSLAAIAANQQGVDRLRNITAPGALFAPATIVNFLRRMPALAAVNGATDSVESVARASKRSLLQEPLHHPQQYAAAFIFCLVGGNEESDLTFNREQFMPVEVIAACTKLGKTAAGKEIIEWSKPTTDFTLRTNVQVANRLLGPENAHAGDHITTYPAGTRLGDIQVTEPTIGCPGNQMAYAMWDQAIDVIVGEQLWKPAHE